MKTELLDFIRMVLGLFLYALGMVVGYQAQVGYAPWEVFHVGFSKLTGVSIGVASILVGVLVLVFVVYKKEALGLGTIINMVLVGIFFDLILASGVISTASSLVVSGIYVILAMVIISFATYYYVGAGYGAGPRDSLIFYLHRRLKISVGAARRLIEVVVTLLGYFMGGMVGVGTLIFALVTGHIMEYTFRLVGFDPKKVQHRTFKHNKL